MTTIILVSHSREITDGLKKMIEEMIGKASSIKILSCGGADDNRLGSNPLLIKSAIEENYDSDHLYLFADIGSAVMSVDMAIDMVDESLREKCVYFDAPLIEGSFVTAVQCMVDPSIDSIRKELVLISYNKFR